MMKVKLFLGVQALLFIPYGLYCLVNPHALQDSAGVVAVGTTGTIELQAMYGGLQTALGVMCALGVVRERLRFPCLFAMLFVFSGLAVVRVTLGLMHGDFSSYTSVAMAFETISLLLLLWLITASDRSGGGVTAAGS